MKRFLIWAAIVIVIVLAGGGIFITNGLAKTAALSIGAVDFSGATDGHYQGEFVGGRWSNQVEVTILSGKITAIKLLKTPTFNLEDTNNQLFARVIAEQSTQVDVVSGATASSKAMLKAIENALNSAK